MAHGRFGAATKSQYGRKFNSLTASIITTPAIPIHLTTAVTAGIAPAYPFPTHSRAAAPCATLKVQDKPRSFTWAIRWLERMSVDTTNLYSTLQIRSLLRLPAR